MPEIEDEPIIEEQVLEDEPVLTEDPPEEPNPLPDYVTREQLEEIQQRNERQEQELAELRSKLGQPAPTPVPADKPLTPRQQLQKEVEELEARGQYASDEWKQDRLIEIAAEQSEQRTLSAIAPFLRKSFERDLVDEATQGVQEAVPVIQTALREGKISPQDLQNPQIAEWARKAAQFDAAATPAKKFPTAAPVGGVQPTAGLRARLTPAQKQELSQWETDLGMKYTDDMIREGFNLA